MSEKEKWINAIRNNSSETIANLILADIERQKEKDKEIERLNNIIKEVREYIASFNLLKDLGALEKEPISISELKHILEILDKEN